MKLVQTIKAKKPKSKRAVEHFKCCPMCKDSNLIVVSPEVLCSICPWDSTKWSVSMGRMDNLFYAAIEHSKAEQSPQDLPVAELEILPSQATSEFDKAMGDAS
jgi:hypothetical protein